MARRLIRIVAIFALLTLAFYWIVADDWHHTALETETVSASGLIPVDDADQFTLTQTIVPAVDELQAISLIPGQSRGEITGDLLLSVSDGENCLWSETVPCAELVMDELNEVMLSEPVDGVRGKQLSLTLEASGTGVSFRFGDTVSAGKFEVEALNERPLLVNGQPAEGQLVLRLRGINILNAGWLAWVIGAACCLAVVLFVLLVDRQKRTGKANPVGMFADLCTRYAYLLKTLVSRDFRIKYQASVLGVLWSFLNPLLTMAVYLFVFSTIFKSNIEYFPVYLMSGIVLFNYFSESTNLGLGAIVSNRTLITKVYMPKYIYPISKVLSSAINLVISFIPLFLVMLVTGVPFHKSLLLLPLVVLFLVVFCTGMSLLLSSLNVFFRDTQFLWGVLLTIWNFLTPIFYPESIIPASFTTVYHLNPLYQITFFMRCIIINGISPNPITYLYCFLVSFVPLLLGFLVFRRQQDRFILYL